VLYKNCFCDHCTNNFRNIDQLYKNDINLKHILLKKIPYKGELFLNYSVLEFFKDFFKKLVKMVSLEFVIFSYIVFNFRISLTF